MNSRCIIIDDDAENVKIIEQVIEETFEVNHVASFNHPTDFLNHIKSLRKQKKELDFDFYIVDYNLPDISGFELIQKLDTIKCIITSPDSIPADEAFAIEHIIDVLRITKPFKVDRLKSAIKKVRDKILEEHGFVVFKTSGGYQQRFALDEIVYIKTAKRIKQIFIKSQIEPIETPIDYYDAQKLNSKLMTDNFYWINDNALLNINYFSKELKGNLIEINYPLDFELEDHVVAAIMKKHNEDKSEMRHKVPRALQKITFKIGDGKEKGLYKLLGIPHHR